MYEMDSPLLTSWDLERCSLTLVILAICGFSLFLISLAQGLFMF